MSQFKNGDSFGFMLRFGFKVDAPAYAVSAQIRDGAMRLIDTPVIRALENAHSYLLAPSQVLDPGRYQFDVAVSSGGAVTHSETYKFTVLQAVTAASGTVLSAADINVDAPEAGQVVVTPVGGALGLIAASQTLVIEPVVFAANPVPGPPGEIGPQGPQGEPGAKGDTGERGLQGPAGTDGIEGAQGPKGDAGNMGPAGPQGEQGPKGDTGTQGADGPQGPRGEPGAKGDTGERGLQGPAGTDGIEGARGPQGERGPHGEPGVSAAQPVKVVQATNSAIVPSANTDYSAAASKLTALTLNLEAGKIYSLTGLLIIETFVASGDRSFYFKFQRPDGTALSANQVIFRGLVVNDYASMRIGYGSLSESEFGDSRAFGLSSFMSARADLTVFCIQSCTATLFMRAGQKHDVQMLARSHLLLRDLEV